MASQPMRAYQALLLLAVGGASAFLLPTPLSSRASSVRLQPTYSSSISLVPSLASGAKYSSLPNMKPHRKMGLRMLVEPSGKDALKELALASNYQTAVQKLPPSTVGLLKATLLPLGAIAGFVFTPSKNIAVKALGSVFVAMLSKVLKGKIRKVLYQILYPYSLFHIILDLRLYFIIVNKCLLIRS